MSRLVPIALAGLATFVAGCQSAPRRALAIEYHPGAHPTTFQVPYDATYELFVLDGSGLGPVPIDRAAVERRHHVGFVRQPDGALVGYAGGRKIPLPEGHFRWQITPQTRISRGDEIAAAVLRVVEKPLTVLAKIGVHVVEALPLVLYAMAGGGH